MGKGSDGILNGLIRFAHETLGLSPNQISTIGWIVGMIAAGLVATSFVLQGLIVLAVSQIIDGLDGGVARRYGLQSEKGQMLEVLFDRTNELAVFLALAFIGEASYRIVVLAFVAILLVTILEPKSQFDPGFKRFILYFGYVVSMIFHVRGFEIALNVIFFANLLGFVIQTVLIDYRFQAEIDRQAILRREQELALGILQRPDDPPSFLSKLFS